MERGRGEVDSGDFGSDVRLSPPLLDPAPRSPMSEALTIAGAGAAHEGSGS